MTLKRAGEVWACVSGRIGLPVMVAGGLVGGEATGGLRRWLCGDCLAARVAPSGQGWAQSTQESMASAVSASGERNPNARRVIRRMLVLALSTRAFESLLTSARGCRHGGDGSYGPA